MTDDYPKAPEGTTAAAFFDSMKRLGMEYAGATHEGGRFQCPHPGHEDDRPSCDVTMGRKGIVLANCKVCEQVYDDHDEWWAECKQAGVRTAGVNCANEDIDWGERAAVTGGSHRVKGDGSERVNVKTITYHYNHEDGKPNFRAYRVQWKDAETGKPDKSFFVKRYDRGGGWPTGFAEDTERTPWKLERFADWAEHHDVLYLVEGEKAAKALHRIKQPATTFQGGAAAPLTEGWVERYGFGRFKEVRVWPDADEAGVVRAKRLLADLKAAGVNAVAWGVTEGIEPKDDAFDVIRRGDFEKGHVLKGGDAVALAALNPLPVKPKKQREKPQEPASLTLPGGVVLVSATGGIVAESDDDEPEEDDGPEPYPVLVNTQPYKFADEVVHRHFTTDDGLTLRWHETEQLFWLWDAERGHYVGLNPGEMRSVTKRLLVGAEETGPDGEVREVNAKPKNTNEVIEGFKVSTLVSRYGAGLLKPAGRGIPFLNGWLDVDTGTLHPPTPERDVRWVVEAPYDPEAQCPVWEAFLDSIGYVEGSEERRLLRQWFGYVLSGSTRLQKALVMVGPKRAGKGTIQRTLEALLGTVDVPWSGAGATTLDRFEPIKTFGLSNLIGKALATVDDARWGKNDSGRNATLLTWISGGAIPAEKKHKDPFSIRPTARLMVASNETPRFFDASDALASRFLMLEFKKSFYDNEDYDLEEKLKGELPGIARWALDGLADLEKVGRFSETSSGLEMQAQVARDSSPVRAFVEEVCTLADDAVVPNDDLLDAFLDWSDRHDNPQVRSDFWRDLKAAFPNEIGNARPAIRGRRVQCKTGIKLNASVLRK